MANFIETEMLPVSKYLSTAKILKVPEFQRSYAWTEDEVSQLWDDVLEAIENQKPEYFIGPIVVKDTKEALELIDGQQRLTTALIILSVIRRLLRNSGDNQRADWFRNKFFGEQDLITLETTEKFFMNDENNDIFRRFVIADASKEDIQEEQKKFLKKNSNHLLLQSIITLWTLVEKYHNGEIERLLKIHDYLFNNVKILVLSVQDEADAYVIFETLNDRGRSLDTLDLLKNHLFSKAKSYLPETKEKWNSVKENLTEIDPKNRFLSHFWLSNYGRSSKTSLFRTIRDQITSAADAIEFANKLVESSRVYSALQNPSSSYWDSYTQQTRKNLSTLRLLDSQQSLPILMAAAVTFDETEFRKLTTVLVVMAVRYNLICEGRTGVSSNYYSDIPKKIRSGTYTKSAHISKHLQKIYPCDEEFKEAFLTKTLTDTKRARYLLIEIEENEYGNLKTVNSDPEQVNLEHIMPKSANQHWGKEQTDIENESRGFYVNRLGNMALVPKNKNKRVGSKPFKDKKEILFSEENNFKTNQHIEHYQNWGKIEIEERQEYLAELSLKTWKIDFN